MTRRRRTALGGIAAIAVVAALALFATPSPAAAQKAPLPYRDATLSVEARVADLLARMTLPEKLGQMTLIEKGSVAPAEAARFALGGVLSGGGGYPAGDNTVAGWAAMVRAYQDAALGTRLGIPLLYGVDAVHGHANLAGAVVFPHNVGLGAADDPELVEAIGRATALELLATGITWNYAPVLAVPRDVRWGRTYEGYGEDPELVTRLALAAMRGLQGDDLAAADAVLATPKHFVGDGGTAFGSSPLPDGLLDRGVTDVDEATLRAVHLAPYAAAVEGGARSVMVSFSSWGGLPMHAQRTLIQDVLRGELGFTGFVVSDWAGIDAVAPDYADAVVASVNAGIDLNMVPYDAERFIVALRRAVDRGDVAIERIDEAVAAILRVKFEMGLFERPFGDAALRTEVGSDAHRALARDAVARTLVLLKNEDGALPLDADAVQTVLVAGSGADSIGVQSGGWTIEWQGSTASLTPGTTVLQGLEERFGDATSLRTSPRGRFTDADGAPLRAELGIAVVGEPPYAEWFGDSADLALPARDRALVETLRAQVDTLVVVVLSGRPVVLDGVLELADAVVAAWLPGTEGAGIADVLFGERDFVGTLPYTWPRSVDQLPYDFEALATEGCDAPLFPRGYGLTYADRSAGEPWLRLAADCAASTATGVDPAAGAPGPSVVALPDPDGPALVEPALLRDHRSREAVFVPFPVPIALDGELADWNGIPFEVVDTGPMTSLDPAENGHFRFAAAADEAHLYLYMAMPDATIVTGRHGTDYWNEDSLEFYVNFSDDLLRRAYGEGVFQVNVNPSNLGNTDPANVGVTGIDAERAGVRAFVFATADGWGFEAAVPIPEGVDLRHGLEIGLQAHANGSSGDARDVKLIWSAADTGDTSWQDPSVFGRGVFYELGNPAPLTISERTEPEVVEPRPQVAINQSGYLPGAPHFGMLANQGTFATSWALIDDATGQMVYADSTGLPVADAASGDTVHVADFTGFDTPGTYRLMINGVVSTPFVIGDPPYARLAVDAARYFYLSRSGIELVAEHAGPDHARPAGHLSDDEVTCYRGIDADGVEWPGCDYTLDVSGGWYDAGDYGKYVVNGGISAWTLLNLHERLPHAFPDGSLNLPESGNGVGDLLDEARWQMTWLLSMQVPEGYPQAGMVHHKLHDLEWEGLPLLPATEFDNDPTFEGEQGRYLYPPSTAATFNLAATAAQCARVWRDLDAPFAQRCLEAAERAFRAGVANPLALAGNTPGTGGGNYGDARTEDERFWAAAELFVTTGDSTYAEAMRATPYATSFAGLGRDTAMTWGDTATLGALSLILHDADLPELASLRAQLLRTADGYLETIATEGYRVPIRTYVWGSNSTVLNDAIVLAYAHDLTGDPAYLHGVLEAMDYLLGRNALAFSFVSGYGERSMTNPHHRFWANEGAWPPPPPGVVAGGPNASPSDPTALEHATLDAGPARRYVDLRGSWSTNEVTINWNAPLVWVAARLAEVGGSGALATAQAEPALRLVEFSDGVPTGEDAFGNPIGFSTWQDGGGALELTAVEIAPGDPRALPGQTEPESVLRVDHRIASWGGVTHAFFDEAITRWVPVDLSAYSGLRFWYAGAGSGGQVQVDVFDNRDPSGTRDSAERWFFRFPDDTTDWKLVEIPFASFARRTDFQPSGAPDDGLGLDQASGWALGFPPGDGTSLVARPEAYGASGVVAEGVVAIEFAEPLVRVLEGADGAVRLVLSEASDEAISVRVFVQGDEATPFRDLVPANELVVFPPGVTEATVDFRTLQDARHEGDERAVAVLDGPRGAALGFQRRSVIVIADDDPFDPDLIGEFGDGIGAFEAGPGTTVRTRELLADAENARPDQDRFEPVLALSWDEGPGAVGARFAEAMDASVADGLAFWFHGDGSGREVRVRVLDGRDESRPWALAWSDEFDGPAGTTPDPSVWTPEIGDGTANGIPGWGNDERQAYTGDPANVALDGEGHLVIRALEAGADAPPCYYGAPCAYTSARIVTAGALEVAYGRIEARLKIPTGQGLWAAFWMLGNDLAEVDWPEAGEIDVMENVGHEPDVVHGTIHGPGYAGGDAIGHPATLPGGASFADDLHVYAIDWSPAGITWSVDGVAYATVTPDDLPNGARWVYDHPFFLILNVAVGGNWPGYPDATTTFPQELVVDYVRVYAAPDTSARFETSFRDEAEGWTRVRLPFDGFVRAGAQPDGAPDDGFTRSEVWGIEIDVAGDGGSALLDELRWYRTE